MASEMMASREGQALFDLAEMGQNPTELGAWAWQTAAWLDYDGELGASSA